MTSEVESVPATMTLHGAAAFLTAPETRHPSFPVIDENGHVLGLIDPPAILRWRRAGKHRTTTLGDLLAGSKVTLAYPDESGRSVGQAVGGQCLASAGRHPREPATGGLCRLEGSDARAVEETSRGTRPFGIAGLRHPP